MARLEVSSEHVVAASLTSVEKSAQNRRRFVFQVDVVWSDGRETSCFRGYSDFFEFQCELLTLFPQEAGGEKDCFRTIPYLPGKRFLTANAEKLALERLPSIDQYVKSLLALPERISRSKHVTKFFVSNWPEDTARGRSGGYEAGSSLAVEYRVESATLGEH